MCTIKKMFFVLVFSISIIYFPVVANASNYSEWYDDIVESNSELGSYITLTDTYSAYELESIDGYTSAILFQFYDNNVPVSYFVVSCNSDYNLNCIEFGEGLAEHIVRLLNQVSVENAVYRLLYLENLTYVLEYENQYFYIQDNQVKCSSQLPEAWIRESESTQYYQKGVTLTWDDVKAIEDSGYVGGSRVWAPSGSLWRSNYRTMSYFGSGGICSSTACYNMAVYWYHRGYTNFDPTTDAKRKSLFNTIFNVLGEAAAITKVYNAYEILFYKYGYSCGSTYTKNASWSKIISELSKGAIHVHLRNSQIYGDHGVLGVGYVSFAFESGWKSSYIIIVDGWNSSFRYVNYSLGIDRVDITTVNPSKQQPQIAPTPTP